MSISTPFRLQPTFSERPWGRRDLSPWFTLEQTGETKEPIGEAWLTGPKAIAQTGEFLGKTLQEIVSANTADLLGKWEYEKEFPLLLKLLFPDDKLSVQVHPDDAQAQAMGQSRGKTECWYALEAKSGATVACGLQPGVTADQVRASVADNSMERLLNHLELKVGDMVFVDAGTVHAIGPGLTLLETQQTSDTTYRMYDYGRPRELHVEQGIGVMKQETEAGRVAPAPLQVEGADASRLIKQKYFTVDRFDVEAGKSISLADAVGQPHCITCVEGDGLLLVNEEEIELVRGTATIVPASCGEYTIAAGGAALAVVRSMP